MYFNASISCTTKLLKPLLVFAFCMAAGLAGLTQITQHRSHPIDVYVGYLIGAGIGVYLVSRTERAQQRKQPVWASFICATLKIIDPLTLSDM